MADVKWIKLSTSMFEDEKIRLIESLPDADTLLIIWIKLLSQAGRTNANGYIFLSENIPFTEEMLSTLFNRPIATVRLALQTFKQFGMIDITDDQYICISNWEKHQNVDGLDKIREQNRLRKQKQRDRLRLDTSRDSHETITHGHATDIEEDKEIDKEKNKKTSCHKFSTSDLENAQLLFKLMLQNNPAAKEPNFDKWADDFRLMRERDNRTDEAIKYLINWTQKDDFWSTNILSPSKLRKQFDALIVKIKKEKEKNQPKVTKGKKEIREEDFDLE
ncbi:phage replisome organizer N-terminal domain-containing protein [Bacillus mycoides]|uniref:phage replisome organizer N-terminal domain-containing protein n=1 Tax=Bacillus mycoides TaxID=1405 RepID=UPI002E234821|nr:phage replisome organizer N-terminal domain-containing protein [Bacillus mycoides]